MALQAVGLEVVIDQHRLPGAVAGDAVHRQCADLLRATASVDHQLHGDPYFDAGLSLEFVEVLAQVPDYFNG